jgi:hypothetical protein
MFGIGITRNVGSGSVQEVERLLGVPFAKLNLREDDASVYLAYIAPEESPSDPDKRARLKSRSAENARRHSSWRQRGRFACA